MCGIAGFSRATTTSIPDGRILARSLALAIEARGHHATGFGWSAGDGWPYYWKSPGRASKVVADAPLPTGLRALIAHTRYATQGSPDDNRNNHPVVAPGIVLVHNGRVDNDADLIDAVSHTRTGEVDSEALAALLALGPEALGATHAAELLEHVEGVAAIAWLDTATPDAIHLARLATRPLAIARTRRGDLLFASTPVLLRQAAAAAGVTLFDVEVIPEGTYLLVVAGRIVERRRFKVRRPAQVRPEDVPVGPWSGGTDADWPSTVIVSNRRKKRHGKGRGGKVVSRPAWHDWEQPRLHGITDYFDQKGR